jgi:predicted lactoylglutathione lyase
MSNEKQQTAVEFYKLIYILFKSRQKQMSNEKQQTAVEWFNDEVLIHLNFDQRLYLKDIFNKAKEMEKEQIKDAWKNGRPYWGNVEDRDAEEYYNETYG